MTGGGPARRVALVVNPRATTAGRHATEHAQRVLEPLGLEWTMPTAGHGDAGVLAARAVAEGADVVATIGGDGTVSDVAGALAGGAAALLPLPGGNANVFGRALGWPGRMDDALALVPAAVGAPRRTVHLGRIAYDGRERIFAMNCGVGVDAATVDWVEHRPRVKRVLRQAGFALGAAVATSHTRRAPHLQAVVDDGEPVEVATLIAASGSPYTFLRGRPLDLVPGADFDRAAVHWTALRSVQAREVARVAMGAIRGRGLPAHDPALITGAVERSLRLTAPEPVFVQADGEALGAHTGIVVAPGPLLHVVVPAP